MKIFAAFSKKVITGGLLIMSFPVVGHSQTNTDPFLDYGDPSMPLIVYYKEVPNRFFIQKREDISQDYIQSKLNVLTDSQLDISWCSTKDYQDNLCRIIVDDSLIDSIIDVLLNDEGILTAHRIYVTKKDYDNYVSFMNESNAELSSYFKEHHLQSQEIWFFNDISCYPLNYKPSTVPKDSIEKAFGIELYLEGSIYKVKTPKKADFFEIANKLLTTGYFMGVDVSRIIPYYGMVFDDNEGCDITKSDHFFFYNLDTTKKVYYEIPNRFFIQRNDSVTKDYIKSLVNRIIGNECQISWPFDNICRIIVDGQMNNEIITEILDDEGVVLARPIYVTKTSYDRYLFYPDLERYEEWIFNNIKCYYDTNPEEALIDSIADVLGLTIESKDDSYVEFMASKKTDIFEVSQKLFEEGCFTSVNPHIELPYAAWNNVVATSVTAKEFVYYNLSGQRISTPSGLTIVVTRYSDGTVRSEKGLFR